MKAIKKLVAVALVWMLVMTISPATSINAESSYTYTVTISAGIRGVFNEYSLDSISVAGKEESEIVKTVNEDHTLITISNLEYGDRLIVDMGNKAENNPITLNQAKYYNKGVRKSGHDNTEAFINSSIEVKGDEDYVVAYGIAGNMVAYTIYYINSETNENLLEPQVYYGSIGEKPVVPYQYVEGYLPQAYNLTKTLDENAEVNVFEFDYIALKETQPTIITNTVTVEIPGDEFSSEGETLIIPPVVNNPENEELPIVDPNEEETYQPEEIIDIDEEDVPLVNDDKTSDEENESGFSISSMTWGIAIGIILILILIFVLFKKKQEESEKQDSE